MINNKGKEKEKVIKKFKREREKRMKNEPNNNDR
jgi:hypothetical protein